MKIYIAGPMRGIKHFNFPAFDAARDRLKAVGCEVISPADLDRQIGFDEKAFPEDYDWRDLKKINFSIDDAIERDVKALKSVNAIYLLKGWENSAGARAERGIAEWRGLEIYEEGIYEPYRLLEDGEIIEKGDEFKDPTDGEWGPSAFAGKAVGSPGRNYTYRRKNPKPPIQLVANKPAEGQTVENENGGRQSFIAARFDCIPPECNRLLAQCLGFGARKYGKDNWRKISLEDNLAHALNHINEFRRGDTSEMHLVNTLARVNFALAKAIEEGIQPTDYVHPEM